MCRPLCEIIVLTGDFSIVSRFSPLRTWKLHLCLTTITATSRLVICSVRALPTFLPRHERVLSTTGLPVILPSSRSASVAAIRLCRKGSASRGCNFFYNQQVAWVWQGCHTLLQVAWGWQGCHTLLQVAWVWQDAIPSYRLRGYGKDAVLSYRLRGYGKMPYPPIVLTVYLLPFIVVDLPFFAFASSLYLKLRFR